MKKNKNRDNSLTVGPRIMSDLFSISCLQPHNPGIITSAADSFRPVQSATAIPCQIVVAG
jgi:hypothetical protein